MASTAVGPPKRRPAFAKSRRHLGNAGSVFSPALILTMVAMTVFIGTSLFLFFSEQQAGISSEERADDSTDWDGSAEASSDGFEHQREEAAEEEGRHLDKPSSRGGSASETGTAHGGSAISKGKRREQLLSGQLQEILGREAVWQIPSTPYDELKGTVFFAHGCGHKATHFWPRSESCSVCEGWPEDSKLVHKALSMGFAAIAVSSLDVCWQNKWPPSDSRDLREVTRVLDHFRREHGLEKLPLFALGASSGGAFVSLIPHGTETDAVAILISPGITKAFLHRPEGRNSYPPTLFVHMPRDEYTAALVGEGMNVLKSQGVEAAEIECKAMRLSGDFFADRIVSLTKELSRKIFQALDDAGLIDEDGFLVAEFKAAWKDVLKRNKLVESQGMEDAVGQQLHLALAEHEMTSQFAREIFHWFEGVCSRQGQVMQGRCTE